MLGELCNIYLIRRYKNLTSTCGSIYQNDEKLSLRKISAISCLHESERLTWNSFFCRRRLLSFLTCDSFHYFISNPPKPQSLLTFWGVSDELSTNLLASFTFSIPKVNQFPSLWTWTQFFGVKLKNRNLHLRFLTK